MSVATTLCLQSGTSCGNPEIWRGAPGPCLIPLVHGERVPQLRRQPFRKAHLSPVSGNKPL